jgi:uncharacterized protein YgiM (DUF1202 family)
MAHTPARATPIALVIVLALLISACGSEPAEPIPTRTPAPTFTPTAPAEVATVDPAAVATAQAAIASQPVNTDQGAAPVESAPPAAGATSTSVFTQPVNAEVAPELQPTATPPQAAAQVTLTQLVNIRSGPGLTYTLLGTGDQGATYPVIGKSPAGDWWQITFNGQPAWIFGQLVTATATEGVQVAQNIPPAPTAPPPPPATNTPVPAPPPAEVPPTPVPPPAKTYKFNVAVVSKCDRQPAGNWFEGKTYVNGVPQSGYKVVFSYAPDGPPSTPAVQSGPHQGYEGWDQGFYSHIINATGPQAGNWFVWVVDDAGNRISEIANWQSTGPGEGCNQAVVDFDSR